VSRASEGDRVSERNKAAVRRVVEDLFGTGDLGIADEVFAPDYVDHSPSDPETCGLENVKRFVARWRAAFPDTHSTVEDMIAEGDRVAVRWTTRATHRGEYLGVAPTGKVVTAQWLGIFRLSDGRIVDSWDHYETQGLLRQLGVDLTSG
jgi:steroid delta-isomerase-like uncharacterized protein